VARGFPDWKKFPKPKSAKKEKKKEEREQSNKNETDRLGYTRGCAQY